EDDKLDLALSLMNQAEQKGVNLILPTDARIAERFDNDSPYVIGAVEAIPEGKMGLDIGPESEVHFAKVIAASKTILWNGPMGVFEMENFAVGTRAVAGAIVAATEMGAFSLIGGGDSAAAIT